MVRTIQEVWRLVPEFDKRAPLDWNVKVSDVMEDEVEEDFELLLAKKGLDHKGERRLENVMTWWIPSLPIYLETLLGDQLSPLVCHQAILCKQVVVCIHTYDPRERGGLSCEKMECMGRACMGHSHPSPSCSAILCKSEPPTIPTATCCDRPRSFRVESNSSWESLTCLRLWRKSKSSLVAVFLGTVRVPSTSKRQRTLCILNLENRLRYPGPS